MLEANSYIGARFRFFEGGGNYWKSGLLTYVLKTDGDIYLNTYFAIYGSRVFLARGARVPVPGFAASLGIPPSLRLG